MRGIPALRGWPLACNRHVCRCSRRAGGSAMTLKDAMDRYADGDSEAFSEVYDELAPRLYGFLLRATKNQATTEDLLQQTMLQMHRARGTYRRGADVVPWAFAIAKR